MSGKPEDIRPRVISFSPSLDGLNIAAKEDILWPCHAFTVSIPHKRKHDLNIFEETILKLTWIETGDANKIAEITCLDKELVSFIQNRLYHMDLVDDRRNITKKGHILLEKWNNDFEENVEYEYAAVTVFVDLLNGNLLPYIHTGCLEHQNIRWIDEKFIEVNLGTTGKPKHVTCRRIRPGKSSFWNFIPTPKDIVKTVREFRKKYNRYVFMTKGISQAPPPLTIADAITVHDKPELIYLHCVALIQVGNSSLLVTDGVGFGFSERFANYLTIQDWKWIINLKNKGVIDKIGVKNRTDNNFSNKSYKYSEISKKLKYSQIALDKIKDIVPDSSNYEYEFKREIENGIKNLYAALEWALRQVVANNPVPEWEQFFSNQNFRDNEKLLYGFAKKVGFSLNEKNQKLLQVKPGAIRQIEHGKVELQPLLALAIAGANSKAIHPLHNLAKNHPGFLNYALRLKRYRDPIEHGGTEKLNIDKEILEELSTTTISIITTLIPDIVNDLDEGVGKEPDIDIHQDRLKAEIELEKKFGTALLYEMNNDTKEQLIRSEMMLARYDNGKAIEIIKCYYSAVQQILFDITMDRRIENEKNSMKDEAIEKIVQFGFYPAPDAIPEQISTVNTKRLFRTIQGSNTTLGAHLLAIFLLGSENELLQLQKSYPEFVDFVAKLIKLRGHGNQHQFDFSRDDMELLKNNVFKAIKIITEVFQ